MIDYLLYELPPLTPNAIDTSDTEARPVSESNVQNGLMRERPDEQTRLLEDQPNPGYERPRLEGNGSDFGTYQTDGTTADVPNERDSTSVFAGLNALEIAAVAEAKHFMSQRVVQKIVNGIWYGEIVFWESVSVHSKKRAQLYNERYVDPSK